MDLIDQLNWRYAVKRFDPERSLPARQLEPLLEAVRLSPSAFGLQPYRVVVVEDPQLRQSLVEHSMNQDKVANASRLVVVAVLTRLDEAEVERYLDLIARVRAIPRTELARLETVLKGFAGRMAGDEYLQWAKRQAFIALGTLVCACALAQIDACPMEGFDPAGYDRVLGLADRNLTTAVIATLGYRAEDDPYAALAKVRWPMEEFLVRI